MNFSKVHIGDIIPFNNLDFPEGIFVSGSSDGSLSIIFKFNSIQEEEIESFNNDPILMGLTKIERSNFLCVKILDMELLAPMSCTIHYKDDADFLSKKSDSINFLLVDGNDDKIKTKRHEKVDADLIEDYKIHLIDQSASFDNAYELSSIAGEILSRYTNPEIFMETKFHLI